MADRDTLLAHLVLDLRLTGQVEVTATRSLTYILNKSKSARDAMCGLIEKPLGIKLEHIKSVVAEDFYVSENGQGRVDVLAYDKYGEERIIGEAKFDAGISRGQGGDYIRRLSPNGDGVLLFVAPYHRMDYLWGVLMDDVRETGRGVQLGNGERAGEIRFTSGKEEHSNRHVLMVSWRDLLQALKDKTDEITEDSEHQIGGVRSDIYQLRGLTECLDYEAFMHLQENELESFARRWGDITRLINEVIENNSGSGQPFSVQRLYRTGSEDGYVRYFRYQETNVNAWVGFSFKYWGRNSRSPIWFGLQSLNSNKHLGEETYEKVRKELLHRRDALLDGAMPIEVNEGKDFLEVKDNMLEQLLSIGQTIKSVVNSP